VEQVFPTARTQVEIGGPRDQVLAALRAVPGVTQVEQLTGGDGTARALVESPRDRDVRADVVQLTTARGWRLLELHQVGMSLEEVFIRVVAGEQDSDTLDAMAGEARSQA
jgi:hypothetical protein